MATEKKRKSVKKGNGKQTKRHKGDDGEKTVTDKNNAVSPGIVSNPGKGSEKKGRQHSARSGTRSKLEVKAQLSH